MFFSARLCPLTFVVVLFLAVPFTAAQANLFRNSYISFELPPDWECKLDGTEWVCVSKYAKQSKEAIIILAAKEAGPSDTFAGYKDHLKTPRLLHDKGGKITPSKLLSDVKERMISNHAWIDAMHLGSEINSYYTRYLATIKEKLAILVTFSAHKEHYTKYSKDFLQAIESLKVVATKDVLDNRQARPGFNPRERMGSDISPNSPMPEDLSPLPEEPQDDGMKMKMAALVLIIAGVGYYLWQKRRKKQ